MTAHASDRVALLGFSEIVKIRNRVMEMKSRGEPVLELQGGEPFMPTPDYIKEAMKKALDANQTRYAPSSGIPALLDAARRKLAERNHLNVATDQIIVTSGGAHALFCAFQASVNPGDGVILFSPYWTPIRDQIAYCGGVPAPIRWDEVGDAADLRPLFDARLTPKTRVIYLNSPSNPTGNVLTRQQLASIARFAISNDLTVIADEAYEDLVFDGAHVSIASFPAMFERTITVFTLSKSYAMTGWRVGYAVAPAEFMTPLRKLVLNSVNGVSTPSQIAAAAAIDDRSDRLHAMKEEYRRRRDMLVKSFNEAGFRCPSPPGAFYLFPDVRERLGGDSWKAMEQLLERTSIASVPGVVFGAEGEGHLRMSFSTSMDTIENVQRALRRL